jgi:DNA recombination protein RmuC
MGDILLVTAAIFAAVTFVLAITILIRLSRISGVEPLTKEIISQLLRGETDLIKKAGDDQARGVRQELILNLKSFQDSMNKAFSALVEFVGTQTRTFGERLDSGIKVIDEKVAGIADKLNVDIAKMGAEASQNRDSLREVIELKRISQSYSCLPRASTRRSSANPGCLSSFSANIKSR